VSSLQTELAPAVSDLLARRRLVLIAGPCVAESADLCLHVARTVQAMCAARGVGYIFKASFDKANRTATSSFRGQGMAAGLQILAQVRREVGVPVLTDIHLPEQAAPVAAVVDVLQIPAFLCRQTDLLVAAARTGRPTAIKKGQFLAPEDMRYAVDKFRAAGGTQVMVTERGTCFGYHNLVVDMRGLPTMGQTCAAPVIFDATHSVQRPSAADGVSGGDRTLAPLLARAAAAVGIDGLFCEVHPDPDRALSDGPNSLTYGLLEATLDAVVAIRHALAPLNL
jgi:2-dehydro-3-deoxyphosphooctonate aldolase (KDO 8-P synthase)